MTSPSAAFAVTFVRSLFNAFAEMMLGGYMLQVARQHSGNVGCVQSAVVAMRGVGSLVAFCVGIPLYSVGAAHQLADGTVIAATAAVPLLMLVVALVGSLPAEPTLRGPNVAAVPASKLSDYGASTTVVLCQLLMLWAGLQNLVPYAVWFPTLLALPVSILLIVASLLWWWTGRQRPWLWRSVLSDASPELCVAIMLFLYNARPGPSVQLSSCSYGIFSNSLWVNNLLEIIGMCISLIGAALYMALVNGRRHRPGVVIAVVVAAGAAAQATLVPFLLATAGIPTAANSTAPVPYPADDGKETLALLISSDIPTGLCSEIALLAMLVLATESSLAGGAGAGAAPQRVRPAAHARASGKLTKYAVFLSLLDLGSTASDLLTAPLVTATHAEACQLGGLVAAGAGCSAVLALLFALSASHIEPRSSRPHSAAALEDRDDDLLLVQVAPT